MITNNYKKDQRTKYGTILHLDGDKRYAKKALSYYKKLKLEAIVENIPEYKQPKEIKELLEKYKPDILVITGHDRMYKKEQDLYEINNYQNSKYFIQAVEKARQFEPSLEKLVIFAGACESFYEAIISVGANFASSPARTKVEYRDPLIIASKIATTSSNENIGFMDIKPFLKSQENGIGGGCIKGKKKLT